MVKVNKLKSLLSKEFDMKDLGATKKILGMEILRDRASGRLWLSQYSYVKRVLERFNMDDAKPVMGCLMYAMVCTRLDLVHVVSVVSKFLSNPRRMHWDAVKWIFRYLRGTTDYGIMFNKQQSDPSVRRYVDVDYAGDLDDLRSTTGYVFTLWGTYLLEVYDAAWFKELDIQQSGVQLYYDSQNVIYLAKNQVYHVRTKHMDVRFHKIRELVSFSELLLEKVHTSENAADMLIKPVTTKNSSIV
ncbi:Retrovirus-related Pol polyprotein from transposon TNT 1-94 [Vitis vinifera]|uniref:Retrovirus-related Pol polyprotein from transposon TNT 1-94 n=1 Tax=Vitis vinifera TaxID=29760 RepID=A0A438DU80_VITVI|nr:Retrovirus-related Pol polyprotein from transposon TNT 1-94 [Vitis vinifera]